MKTFDWLQLTLFVAALVLVTKPMGLYLVQVLDARGKTWLDWLVKPLERLSCRLMGVEPEREQDWKLYTFSMLMFSLVGALSVVRFRTVVKDTQDTAFVIFAVVVGMASGANHLLVGLVGMGVILVASPLLWPRRRIDEWATVESTLAMRVALAGGVQSAVEQFLATVADRSSLIAASTARQGSCLDLTYRIRLRRGSAPTTVVAEFNMMEGIENVELKRANEILKTASAYFAQAALDRRVK